MKTWMEFIKQPDAKPEYGGRVLITKDVYEEIQRDAIRNHCRACYSEGRFTPIVQGQTECPVCGADDSDDLS
jgi:hypothetical protein